MAEISSAQFSQMVKQYERLVYTICNQLVHNPSASEDLTQDTFLSAYTHLSSCPIGYEKQWLARIAANKAKDYLSSAYSRHTVLPGDDTLSAIFATGNSSPPEELMLEKSGHDSIRQLIYALKEPYKQVCIQYFINEASVEEIAKLLNRPSKTVHTQISRAKGLLREQLERSGYNGTI